MIYHTCSVCPTTLHQFIVPSYAICDAVYVGLSVFCERVANAVSCASSLDQNARAREHRIQRMWTRGLRATARAFPISLRSISVPKRSPLSARSSLTTMANANLAAERFLADRNVPLASLEVGNAFKQLRCVISTPAMCTSGLMRVLVRRKRRTRITSVRRLGMARASSSLSRGHKSRSYTTLS